MRTGWSIVRCRDEIPVRVSDTVTRGTVVPTYAVLQYPHAADGGDAIAGGFVYRGSKLPALSGKFIFGDISTGKLWYADYGEMLEADDGKPDTMAARHEVQIRWTPPGGTRGARLSDDVPDCAGVVPVARRHRSGSARRCDVSQVRVAPTSALPWTPPVSSTSSASRTG